MQQRTYALVLGGLACAFFLRVVGQLVVVIWAPPFLPPMAHWQSGLLPYPVLLTSQMLILLLQFKVSRDLWHGIGFFNVRRPRVGKALCWFSYVYFTAMIVRYVITMMLFPERRWFTGTIPIFLHMVLAVYLYLLGRYQFEPDRHVTDSAGNRENAST